MPMHVTALLITAGVLCLVGAIFCGWVAWKLIFMRRPELDALTQEYNEMQKRVDLADFLNSNRDH